MSKHSPIERHVARRSMSTSLSPMTLLLLVLLTGPAIAQTETYDLVSYTAPAGWQRESSATYVKYTRIDGGSWAQIAVYKHAVSAGTAEADLDADWHALVSTPFKAGRATEKTRSGQADGWTVMNGGGTWQFNGSNVLSLLTTYSGHGVRVSILCNATAQPYLRDCQHFVASASLQPPTIGHAAATSTASTPAASSLGTSTPSTSATTSTGLDGRYGCSLLTTGRDPFTGNIRPEWKSTMTPPPFTLSGNRYNTPHPQSSGTVSRNRDVLTFSGGTLDGFQASIGQNSGGPTLVFRGDNPRAAKPGAANYRDMQCQPSR